VQDLNHELNESKISSQALSWLFTSLQIDAFVIATELRRFIAENPFPDQKLYGFDNKGVPESSEQNSAYMVAYAKARSKLAYGFANRKFATRITDLMLRAGEEVEYPAWVPNYAENKSILGIEDIQNLRRIWTRWRFGLKREGTQA
jgi:hypothetical protein